MSTPTIKENLKVQPEPQAASLAVTPRVFGVEELDKRKQHMSSDTPKTDELAKREFVADGIWIRHARELERENNQLRAIIKENIATIAAQADRLRG